MIPNSFINNSSYGKKEEIRMKGNYPLLSNLGTPIKEGYLCQSVNKPKQ